MSCLWRVNRRVFAEVSQVLVSAGGQCSGSYEELAYWLHSTYNKARSITYIDISDFS